MSTATMICHWTDRNETASVAVHFVHVLNSFDTTATKHAELCLSVQYNTLDTPHQQTTDDCGRISINIHCRILLEYCDSCDILLKQQFLTVVKARLHKRGFRRVFRLSHADLAEHVRFYLNQHRCLRRRLLLRFRSTFFCFMHIIQWLCIGLWVLPNTADLHSSSVPEHILCRYWGCCCCCSADTVFKCCNHYKLYIVLQYNF